MRSKAHAATAQSIDGNGRGTPSLGLLGLCAVAAFLLAALLGTSAAQAANTYVPSGEISAGELTAPARIAVDEDTGNVLVVDTAKNRVDVFDSSGSGASLLTTFGEGDLSGPYGIAIDQSNGDVYVTDPGNEQILRYETDGEPTPAYTLDAGYTGPAAGSGSEQVGSFASAIAVDPTNANLLVADRGNDRISRFSAAGAFVSSFNGADSTDGAFTHLEDVTLSPAGKIFVSDGEAAAGGASRVLRFSSAGAFEATLRALAETGDAYLAYNSARPGLIVGDARECFFCTVALRVLDPSSGAVLFNVSAPSEKITGLVVDPGSGRLYAASVQGEVFAPPKVAVFASQMHPELVLNAPSPTTPFSVHLTGTVDPEGVATEYHFEVSKDGGTTWQKSADASAGEGTAPVEVEADLAVEPNTSYVAKLVATNTEGAQDATATQPFVTAISPPATETRPATDMAETSAVINGTINPYGLVTTYYFEYGPSTAYGTKVPAGIEATAGQGRVAKPFSRRLTGLTPGATYHYRLVAASSAGTVEGADSSFTTLAAGSVSVRGYEQVTPVDKRGASVVPRMAFRAAADGNAVTYTTKSSSRTTPLYPRAMALRESDDWSGAIETDLPTNQPPNPGFFGRSTLAISADYTHTFDLSNRALAPGAFEDGANLYRVDLGTGERRLVAATENPLAFPIFGSIQSAGKYLAGAPDFSWIVFRSPVPLLAGAPAGAIYRWSEEAGLEVVSVLSNDEMSPALGASYFSTYDVVSDDGTRIYYSTYGGSEEGVFLWEEGKPPAPIAVRAHQEGSRPPTLLGINPTGRYAFLVSREKLTPDAPGVEGDLYRYDLSDGSFTFLGAQAYVQISGGDLERASLGIGADGNTIYFSSLVESQNPGGLTVWHNGALDLVDPVLLPGARASENGRYFLLLDYEETELGGYEGGAIHLYDAETGEQSCVSCLPDGTARTKSNLPDLGEVYINNEQPVPVTDDGRVYFDSPVSLVAADVNGTRDVYEFHEGRLTLISPGNAPFDAIIGTSSADGKDVFFTTSQKLVGRDNDRSLDVYDARVNGGLPAQSPDPQPECQVACGAPPSAGPVPTVGGSETLDGRGNVKPGAKKVTCGKGKRKQVVNGKTKCVKKKKSQKRKANTNKKGGSR